MAFERNVSWWIDKKLKLAEDNLAVMVKKSKWKIGMLVWYV